MGKRKDKRRAEKQPEKEINTKSVKKFTRQWNLYILSDEEELISNCCEGHNYLAIGPVKTKILKFCNSGSTKYLFHCKPHGYLHLNLRDMT